MSDDRGLIERSDSVAKINGNDAMTHDQMVDNFILFSPEKRIAMLDTMSRDQQGDYTDVRKAAEDYRLSQRLGKVHRALMRAKR